MNKVILIFIVSNLMLLKLYSQTQDEIITSFKEIVSKTEDTFKKSPIVLYSGDWKDSPSGKYYYKLKFELIPQKYSTIDNTNIYSLSQSRDSSLSYDIQTTNSLVSPYIGFIILTLSVQTTQENGNVNTGFEILGFSDIEKAKLNDSFKPCTDRKSDLIDWCVGDIKVNYAFQDGKWVFSHIETETPRPISYGNTRGAIDRGAIDSLLMP